MWRQKEIMWHHGRQQLLDDTWLVLKRYSMDIFLNVFEFVVTWNNGIGFNKERLSLEYFLDGRVKLFDDENNKFMKVFSFSWSKPI